MNYNTVIFLLVLLLFPLACAQPPAEHQLASDFMGSPMKWEELAHRPQLRVLGGKNCFVVVADSSYKNHLNDNLILAFSKTNAWGRDSLMNGILSYYETMLEQIKRENKVVKTGEWNKISPLLRTSWGQDAPYDTYTPKYQGRPTKPGCVPVALAQLVHYHGIQHQPDSLRFVAEIGHQVGARYSVANTTTSTFNMKPVLVGLYGISPSCKLYTGLSTEQLLHVIHRNLDRQRPVLLTNRQHAFLCDGREGEYLHLNMGYTGIYNGYYRMLNVPDIRYEKTLATSLLADIYVQDKSLSLSVRVEKPGTLSELLGADAFLVSTLQVSGQLNGQDVELLRRMSGAVYQPTDSIGQLTQLTFGQVYFVPQSIYYETDAGTEKFIVRRNKEYYDFNNMSAARWQSFCNKGYNQTSDYRIIQKDGRYKVQFWLSARPNQTYLLMGCENLSSL